MNALAVNFELLQNRFQQAISVKNQCAHLST